MVVAGGIAKVGGGGGKDEAGGEALAAGCGLTKGDRRAEGAERVAAEEEDGEEGEEVRAFLVVCLIWRKEKKTCDEFVPSSVVPCPVIHSPFLVPIPFLHCFPLFFLLFLPCATQRLLPSFHVHLRALVDALLAGQFLRLRAK